MYAIILSALIYVGAYIYPDYLYLGMFVWMLPIVTTDSDNRYGFKAGYTWGLLFFGTHLAWLAVIVYTIGKGYGSMIVYFAAVAYFSLFSGFWLWLKQLLVYRLVRKIQNLKGKYVALWWTWVISTVTFIYLTCYCSLAIFGCLDGYPFINPLLPLVSWTWYIEPIFYFGTVFSWILIVITNLSIVAFYKKSTITSLIFVMLLISFPAMFSLFYKKTNIKISIEKNEMIYLQPVWNAKQLSSAQTFYAIARCLDQIAAIHPQTKYILIPESGFAYNLIEWSDKLDAWTSPFDGVTIFIGGHRALPQGYAQTSRHKDNKIFNSLYQITDGKIIAWYDKTHLVPLVERIPNWVQWVPIFKDVFTSDAYTFSYPEHDQSDLIMAGFRPCICSELFFGKPICRPFARKWPMLFICNDSWLALDYARDLAKRSVKLYSMQHNVPIVYVGSYDWGIIT